MARFGSSAAVTGGDRFKVAWLSERKRPALSRPVARCVGQPNHGRIREPPLLVLQGNRMNVLGSYGFVEEVFVPSGKVALDPH